MAETEDPGGMTTLTSAPGDPGLICRSTHSAARAGQHEHGERDGQQHDADAASTPRPHLPHGLELLDRLVVRRRHRRCPSSHDWRITAAATSSTTGGSPRAGRRRSSSARPHTSTGTDRTAARCLDLRLCGPRRRPHRAVHRQREADHQPLGAQLLDDANQLAVGLLVGPPPLHHFDGRGQRAGGVAGGDPDPPRPEVDADNPHPVAARAMARASSILATSRPPAIARVGSRLARPRRRWPPPRRR